MRIGFLFNHEADHQIAHTAPIIAEIAARGSAHVSVLASSEQQERRVRALLAPKTCERVDFVRLELGRFSDLLDKGLGKAAPYRRIAILKANRALFERFDALVVPETTSALLKTRFGLGDLKLIYLPHGSGDRSVGFRQVTAQFDLVLLAGDKVRDRMLDLGIIRADGHSVVGYPKFDTVDWGSTERFFDDDKPVVLYNPHFDPLLSSWYAMGRPLIDWFAGQDRYNLIVAPHVMLFQRRVHASVEHFRFRVRKDLPEAYFRLPNVRIDTGSVRSVDMSYTKAADLYVGDASSQIYEWIARPRPALFLNPGRIEWRDDPSFAHWRLGEVVEDRADFPAALERTLADPERFADAQRSAFEHTFSLTEQPSSSRAATAILDYLTRSGRRGVI